MGLLEGIKNKLGRLYLNSSGAQRKGTHPIPAFTNIQEIGIIYHADSQKQEEEVNRVAHYLREQGKKVWTMGFVDAKTLPHTKKFHISAEYFWREKLKWNNLPDPTRIGNFISHPFDLVMNLYFEDVLPLEALSSMTRSAYAMGASSVPGALQYNDTVIEMKSNSIHDLATQMIHYLKVINQQ